MDDETKTGQAGTTAEPTPPAPSDKVTGTPDKDAIRKAIEENPELLSGVQVNVGETKVEFGELTKGYMRQSDSTRKWQEAAAMKKEAEALKASVESQGDPIEKLIERLRPQSAPVDPLSTLDSSDPFTATATLKQTLEQERNARRKLEADVETFKAQFGKKVEEVEQRAIEQVRTHRLWDETERELADVRSRVPGFTATVTTDPTSGQKKINPGANPYLSIEALRLSNSDEPDPRLGGRTGKSVPLTEIVEAVRADLRKRVETEITAEREAIERERKATASAVTSTGEPPALPSEIENMPVTTKAEQLAKARKIKEFTLERMKQAGLI